MARELTAKCPVLHSEELKHSSSGVRGIKSLHVPHWRDADVLLCVSSTNHTSDHISLFAFAAGKLRAKGTAPI